MSRDEREDGRRHEKRKKVKRTGQGAGGVIEASRSTHTPLTQPGGEKRECKLRSASEDNDEAGVAHRSAPTPSIGAVQFTESACSHGPQQDPQRPQGSSISTTGAESVRQLGVGGIYAVNEALVQQTWSVFEPVLAPLDRARMASFLTRLCREAGMTHAEISRLLEELVDVDLLTKLCQDDHGLIDYERFAGILRVYFGPAFDEPDIKRARGSSDLREHAHGNQSPAIARFLGKNSDKAGPRKRSNSLFSKKFWGKPSEPVHTNKDEVFDVYVPEALSLGRARYWQPLIRFVCTREITALDALVCVGDTRQSAITTRLIVRILDARALLLTRLHKAIKMEVDNNTNPATLFRENNFATKSMVYLARTLCHAQFEELRPVLSRLAKLKHLLDINEWKASKLESPEEAVQRLESFVTQVLDVIIKNPSPTHPVIKHLAYCLLQEVEQKYKGASTELIGVSSFVFLRAWCPIVTSPDAFGIYKDPIDATMRKNLVLISRILQHIANGVLFSKNSGSSGAEDPLATLNQFIERSVGTLQSFLYSFAAVPTYARLNVSVLPMSVIDEELVSDLHIFMKEHNEPILKSLFEKEEVEASKALQHMLEVLSGEIVGDKKGEEEEKEKEEGEKETLVAGDEGKSKRKERGEFETPRKRKQRPKTLHPSQLSPRSLKKHRRKSSHGGMERSKQENEKEKVERSGKDTTAVQGLEVNSLVSMSESELGEFSALLDIADQLRAESICVKDVKRENTLEAKHALKMIRKRSKELQMLQGRLGTLVDRAREEVPLIVKAAQLVRGTIAETSKELKALTERAESMRAANAMVRALTEREAQIELNLGLIFAATSPRETQQPADWAKLSLSELVEAISRQQIELAVDKTELDERTDQYERMKGEYTRCRDRVDVLLDRLSDIDLNAFSISMSSGMSVSSPSKSRRSLFKSGSSRKSSATKMQLPSASPPRSNEILAQSQRPRFIKQSLEEHLESEKGRESFREFCTESYCEENLDFYFKTQDLLDMKNKVLRSACEALFTEYVQHGAVKQVNLDDDVMKQIAVEIKSGKADAATFAQAANDAFGLLVKDVWPRYKNSSRYTECVEQMLLEEKRFPLTSQATLLRDAAKLVKEESARVRVERDLLDKERQLLKADYWRLESARIAFAEEQARAIRRKLK